MTQRSDAFIQFLERFSFLKKNIQIPEAKIT